MAITIDLSQFATNADGSKNSNYPNGDKPGGEPNAPSGFSVSYLSNTSLSLSWTDNADNELNFELDRSPNGVDTWTSLSDPAANATSATDTGLTVDTTYYYRLRAVNASGNSEYVTANGTTTAPTADYALEIIQPRASLSTTNRFYKQYTGIEYNVRLGVIGGVYPFTYSLTTKPTGMTIDANTGEITWTNPVEAGSPHSITAQVTDDAGSTQSVSWTLTVTTTGFKFVDSASGNDANAGTLAAPWQTLSKISDANVDDFIYFRAGSYTAPVISEVWDGATESAVWMAYPGETVNFDFSNNGYSFYNVSNKLYIDGFTINLNSNTGQRGFSYVGSQSNITFRRNTFSGLLNGGSNTNPSYIFSMASSSPGDYTVLQDNAATNGSNAYFFLGYSNNDVLVEDNDITGFTGTGAGAISPKDGNGYWVMRGNTLDVAGTGINIQGYDSRGVGRGPQVIEFNNIEAGTVFAVNSDVQDEPVIVDRNTFRGRFYVRPKTVNNGPYTFSKNVIVNDNDAGYTDRILIGPEGDLGVVNYGDNLVGVTSDGIVDANGDLQGAYRTIYLGTHGHEVS